MSLLDDTGFLACRDCQVMEPLLLSGEADLTDAPIDDLDAFDTFVACHSPHRTARLRRCGSELCADRPVWDPMAIIWFAVTDERQTYVVRGERRSIDEPRVYRFAPGVLEVKHAEVSIDDGELRSAMDQHFYPHALRASKLDSFVALVRAAVAAIVPAELEIAFDLADDPALSVARMPDAVYQRLLSRCPDVFTTWEMERLANFLRANRNEDGVLALHVRREFSIVAT
jgi:hypothetical protein